MAIFNTGNTPRLNSIRKEYGDIDSFRAQAKDWLDNLPKKYLKENKDVQMIRNKNVDWEDPTVLTILHRKITSIDHIDWIRDVVNRIDTMKRHIENARIENHDSYPTDRKVPEKVRENVKREKSSALDFMDSVRDYALRNLKVTERQLEALNETYKKFERLI